MAKLIKRGIEYTLQIMMKIINQLFVFTLLLISLSVSAQNLKTDPRIYDILNDISVERLQSDIQKLVDFGTRHTMSDTVSDTRGIGAARRWIKSEYEKISAACGGCLEIYEQRTLVKGDPKTRINKDTYVVNIYAIKRGVKYPNRYVIMTGDIDSRISDPLNSKEDSPGANDNASGMAAAIELARVLSSYDFPSSILLGGLSGEEQGLYGGRFLAEKAKEEGWEVIGILNNDMIGNIEGVDGVIDNRTFRIFSEPYSSTETQQQLNRKRFYGGENDGISRQLARYVYEATQTYLPEMNPMIIYRLDRFGRGGHHRPFNEAGFAGVRIMEAHENYNRQHQDLRTEDGIKYGDVIDGVNFEYCKKLTGVNAATLASLAFAPTAPQNVKIGGIVRPSTRLMWDQVEDASGYKVYWRFTTDATWRWSKLLPKDARGTTLEGIVIDNYLFGVSAVGEDGHESVVSYPSGLIRR
ncbi:MAG: M28 family peptidase [Cyclobacteriaceae bacterium]